MTDLTGQQFGNYRLVRCLGVGGFSRVYLGQHVHISSMQAAIKILDLRDVNAQEFQQEAETTARLVHPTIVRLLDFDIQEGTPFLVLDYAPGGSLRARHPKGSQVPLSTVIGYLREIVPALQHAHDQQILHRDIKPDNILVGRQGELLLSDFGIALLSRTGKTSVQGPTNIEGTPYYMAPEQFRGRPGKASDQYALAIVIYEWLCGTVPFTKGDFIELGFQHTYEPVPTLAVSVPTLPASVEQVVMKALAKQPQDRFPSVEAFERALEASSTPSSSQDTVSLEPHQSTLDRSTDEPSQTRESISAETPTLLSSLSGTTEKAVLLIPSPLPDPAMVRRPLNKRMLFILATVLLITLSGGGLSYFGFVARTSTPSPTQATATAAAQAYATGTAKQGVMFGFDAAHTRNNPYEHTLSSSNVSRLMLLWSFPTGNNVSSSPAVAGGMVYIGSTDKKLYAFDASCRSACQLLWSFPTRGSVSSPIAVAGGIVYVGSMDKKLYAFDASCRSACQPLWSFTTEGPVSSSPAVAGGMVYVGSTDKKLYAFDASCRSACQPLWIFVTGGAITSSPAVAGGVVYVGSRDSSLYVFDVTCRSACQPLWNFATGGDIRSSPAIADGMVYVGSWDGKLYAFGLAA